MATADSVEKDILMIQPKGAMNVLVCLLQKCELESVAVKTKRVPEWKCVLLLVFYCCDIPEAKDISAV